jgi:hypothetical protein
LLKALADPRSRAKRTAVSARSWPGIPAHISKERGAPIASAYYSSELNSDEWVWKNVKHDRIGKTGVTSKDDLKAKAIGALRRLQKFPALVRGFFADPHLRYITAKQETVDLLTISLVSVVAAL